MVHTVCIICMESLKLLQYFLAVKCLIDIFMKWSPLIAKILEVISLRLNSYYKTMMNCVTQWRLYHCRYKLAMYFFTINMYIHTHTHTYTHTQTHTHTHTHTHIVITLYTYTRGEFTFYCTFVIPSNIAVTKIKFVNALLENVYHC